MNPLVPSETSVVQRTEIVFIESNISDYQTLLSGVIPGMEVHVLDATTDGLAQMAQILAGRTGIDAIHVISHGAQGSLQLGTNDLTAQNMASHATELATIGSVLKPGGDILLYGCSAGRGEAGAQFIGRLAQAAGADINASNDLTGAATQGGDWQLEYATGNIETTALNIANYQGVLAAPIFSQITPTAFTKQTPVAVSSTIILSDPDGDADWNGGQLTIQITANSEASDWLGFSPDQPGPTFFWVDADRNLMAGSTPIGSTNAGGAQGNDAWVFTFNSNATNAVLQELVRAVTFGNNSDVPSPQSRTVTLTATDAEMLSANATQTIDITELNDAAVITIPGATPTGINIPQVLTPGGTLVFSAANGNPITVTDADVGTSLLEVTLLVGSAVPNQGALTLGNVAGLESFNVDDAASGRITLLGTLPAINAALDGLTYTLLPNYTAVQGFDWISIVVRDQGGNVNVGSDGRASIEIQLPASLLTYSATTFAESPANDGSITTTSTITLINETFAGNDGDDWSPNVHNVPAGLTPKLIRDDATHATLSFTGQAALAHANANDVNNLTVTFSDWQFTGGSAATVAGATTSNLMLDFADFGTAVNEPPVVNVPGATPMGIGTPLNVPQDGSLVFSSANGNAINISDLDSDTNQFDVFLYVMPDGGPFGNLPDQSGIFKLGSTSGLFISDNGNGNMRISGSLTAINAALEGLVFTPPPGYNGNCLISILAANFSDGGSGGAAIALMVTSKTLSYGTTTFTEDIINDGTISASSIITLTNETFAGNDGDDWSPNVGNVPAGLTPKLIRVDATHAILSFTGQAVAHANAEDVNNLTVSFSDWQFTGGSAATVAGATTTNLAVDFVEPLPKTLTYSATTFVESATNDGSITTTSTISLTNETFTGMDGYDWSSIVTNVPAGLTASLIRTDATHATLSFTGQAAAHTNANDLGDLTVNFDNTKFTGSSAVEVTGAATNNLSIDFTDPPVNHAPTIGQPMFATKRDFVAGGQRVISADVNSDGKADLIASSYAAVSVLINNGDGSFAAKVDYAAGAYNEDILSADVNGDGKADLIVENTSVVKANTVSVLINNGDGSFAAKVNYNTDDGEGFETGGITSADVNSDGMADLIVTHKASDQLSVLINNGDGTFAPKVDYAAGWRSRYIISADVNNDGTPDLIMANGGRFVSVLINNGTGSFVDKVDYEVGGDAWDATSADANGDGNVDLIIVQPFNNTVSVLTNNGDGSFADRVSYAAGQFPVSVTSADVNGDGTADLIVANRDVQTISVLAGEGDGSFAAKTEYAVELSPQDVTSADVDGDGKPDLIVTGYSTSGYTVAVLLNSPVTAFDEQTPVSVSKTFMVSDPDGDAAWSGGHLKIQITANSEANDSLSLLTANPGGNAIWLDTTGNKLMAGETQIGTADASSVSNDSAWTFTFDNDATNALVQDVARAVRFYNSSDTPGTGKRTVSFTVTDSGLLSASATQIIAVTPVKKLTFSATSFVEAAANDGSITSSSTITLVNDTFTGNNGDNWSAIVSNVPAGLTAALIRTDATHATLSFTGQAAAHGNMDDRLDLTVAFDDNKFVGGSASAVNGATTNNLAIYFAEPSLTTFSSRVDYTTGANAHGLLSIDVNNDGKIDLINANYEGDTVSVLLGNGDGSFANKVEYATGSKARGLTSADVNGDGKVDLVVTNADSDSVSVLINNGNGSFAGKVDFATGDRPYGVTSADFNSDGNADLVVANQWSDNISVLFGNGNGSFANKVDYTVGGEPVGVASADLNNDGKVDLIVSNRESSTVSVFINNGNGSFAARSDYATGMGPTGVVIADVNGDGNGDLITANAYGGPQYGGTVSVLAGLGDGNFGPMVEYKLTNYSSPYFLTVADVNGDAKPDLILPNSARGTIAVLSNIGDGSFSKEIEYAVGMDPLNIASADFNGDGKMDVVVGHYREWDYTDAKLSVLLNTQDNSLSPDIDGDGIMNATENSVPGLWRDGISPILGDGNGDGIRDSSQNEITSVPFLATSTAVSNPGSAPASYVTLVADAQAGLVDTTDGNSAVLTQLKQLDAPADKPANIDMPLGLISFVADVGTPGVTETFSLFVDHSIPVNGYFKKNAAGDWVNIATSVVDLYSKTRVDFAITDGGEFDSDGQADGIITDPGALGFQAPMLAYSALTFVESAANYGAITTTSTITLTNETFTGNNGEDWSAIVSNVPTGLTASLIRTDATHATLSFTGQAAAHANINDLSDLTVIFDNGKFTGGSAVSISGATTSNLLVDFADPAVNHAPTGRVTITGTATEGQTLTATNDLADADGQASLSVNYQWQADGADIAGASNSTLLLDQSLVGKPITVVASYLDAFNTAESQTSLATATVANIDDAATGTLLVTGTAAEGASLLANLSDVLDSDGSSITSYRWQEEIASNWADITGATTATLSIPADQSYVGKNVRVVATTLDVLGGTTEFIGNAQTIANINDAPTGSPVDTLPDGTEDTSYTISAKSLLAGFMDIDGDNLSIANLTADHASVTDRGDGTWTLAPASNYNGQVSLNYDVMDGNGGSISAMQNFVLLAVDDVAVVGSADVTVEETNAPLVINGALSINDIDSPASFVAQPGSGGKYGTFTLGTDGAWSYKAKLAYDYLNVGDSLKDSFQVKASDGTTSSVSVTIAGTVDTTSVHLGDAPTAQSGTGGQWAQAWSQTGYSLSHKSDHTNSAEAWSAVKLSGVSSQLLTGGDIYAGDLGVSGQSAVTSTIRQEIDGKEALRVNLPTAADSVTLKLSRLFTNDDGGTLSESGLLRLLDAAGQVVAEKAFYADSAGGAKTVTLAAAGFTSLELIAGAYNSAGTFSYGGYSTAAGDFGGAVSTDSAGKFHGSDFLIDSMDFAVMLVGVA